MRRDLIGTTHGSIPGVRRIGFRSPSSAVLWLALLILASSCRPNKFHDHVAEPNRPASLETAVPTWVGEFSETAVRANVVRPHVLLISLDTLRADHLGAWGYERATSPFLDELARFGVRFDLAFSHSPKTAPSHMSVFTGVFPSAHGAHIDHATAPPVAYPNRNDLVTLPEVMRAAGYRTAAWTGGGQVSKRVGFARGFDQFIENLGTLNRKKTAAIRTWFRSSSHRPCFIFLHTYQIHDPYLPPNPYDTIFTDSQYQGWVVGDRAQIERTVETANFESLHRAFWRNTGKKPDPSIVGDADRRHLLDLYDGGIRYTDDVLQGFFQDLRDDGLLENTLVVIFSDHGEEFLEHGGLLHEKLYRETLHVPLIFFWPAHIPREFVVEIQVPLMDLTPTVLELVGLEPLPQSDARSLTPLFTDTDRRWSRPVFSEEPWVHPEPHRSFRDGGMMIYEMGIDRYNLFDITVDPLEAVDLSATRPDQTISLVQQMTIFLAGFAPTLVADPAVATELTEEEIEALRALGYVE